MQKCLSLINAAISMAESEYEALVREDMDTVEEKCSKRSILMNEFLTRTKNAPGPELVERLTVLQKLQGRLRDEAARQREDIRSQLFQSRQQSRRLSGYRKSINMAMSEL